MRTAILGAGALGIIIGALMTKNGKQVDLIDSFKENVDVLKANGATVTGNLELHQPVTALMPEEMTGTYDLILLLTKQCGAELGRIGGERGAHFTAAIFDAHGELVTR